MNTKETYYPFGFMEALTSLETQAATKLALILWQNWYDSARGQHRDLDAFLRGARFSSVNTLPYRLPTRISNLIDDKIEQIRFELKYWTRFHRKEKLFDGDFDTTFSQCFHLIAIKSNGTIDFKATASRLLQTKNVLSNVEKYKIACTFCLEPEIRRIWPSLTHRDVGSVAASVALNGSSNLIIYWQRRLNSIKDRTSIMSRTMRSLLRRNGAAFEYFWNQLEDEIKSTVKICSLLKRVKVADIDIVICLLSRQDQPRAEQVFAKLSGKIIDIIVQRDQFVPFLSDLITNDMVTVLDKRSYFKILYKLYKIVFNYCPLAHLRCHRINVQIQQIWYDAPQPWKTYVLNDRMNTLFNNFIHHPRECFSNELVQLYDRDMTFVYQLLASSSIERRCEIFRKHWQKFAFRFRPSSLYELMLLCLPNGVLIEKFRKKISKCTSLCRSMAKEGMYSQLCDYLKVFLNGHPAELQQTVHGVVKLCLKDILMQDNDKLDEFDVFLNNVLFNVTADQFKTDLICSDDAILVYIYEKYVTGELDDLRCLINRFVTSADRILEIKHKIKEICCRKVVGYQIPRKFDIDRYLHVVRWCIDHDPAALAIFKSSLNARNIFNASYQHNRLPYESFSIGMYEINQCFEFLDAFFRWYFVTEEQFNAFKQNMIRDYYKPFL